MIITFDTLTMRSTHFTLTNYHCSVLHKITTIQLLVLLAILLLSVGVEAQRQSVSSVSDNGNSGASEGNSKFSPLTAIIVIVIVLCSSILGGLSLYIQHCFGMPSSTLSPGRMNNNGTNGLGQSVIDVFPVFEYSAVKELKSGKGELECAVCLCEFHEDETLRLLPKCNHVFHSQCIDAWLVGHTTCPVCRANLVPDPDKVFDNTAVSLQSLSAEVRRQLLARTKLKRATSLVDLPSQPNSRRGYPASSIDEDIRSSKYGLFFGRSIMSRVGSFGSTAKVVE